MCRTDNPASLSGALTQALGIEMNVELRDGLTVIAIVLSMASFGLALWNARFTRRAKNVELRASTLVRISEARAAASKVHDRVSLLKRTGKADTDAKLAELLGYNERLSESLRELEAAHARLELVQSSDGLATYEAVFHMAQYIVDRAAGADHLLSTLAAERERL